MGATERKPLGREVENNLVEVEQRALEILCVRLGAVAVPARWTVRSCSGIGFPVSGCCPVFRNRQRIRADCCV